jgi:hypothetical protein
MKLQQISAAPAYEQGYARMWFENDGGTLRVFARMQDNTTPTLTDEVFMANSADLAEYLKLDGTSQMTGDIEWAPGTYNLQITTTDMIELSVGQITLNPDNADMDIVMKGDTDSTLFHLDAGNDIINLNDTRFNTFAEFVDNGPTGAPATPAAGHARLYVADDILYYKDDNGDEYPVSLGGANVIEVQVFS